MRKMGWSAATAALVVAWGLSAGPASAAPRKSLEPLNQYVVKGDVESLSQLGYEGSWPADGTANFNAGNPDVYLTAPSFVAHPPIGSFAEADFHGLHAYYLVDAEGRRQAFRYHWASTMPDKSVLTPTEAARRPQNGDC